MSLKLDTLYSHPQFFPKCLFHIDKIVHEDESGVTLNITLYSKKQLRRLGKERINLDSNELKTLKEDRTFKDL